MQLQRAPSEQRARKPSALSLAGKLLEQAASLNVSQSKQGQMAAESDPKIGKPLGAGQQPSWAQLARLHAGQYVFLLVLLVLLAASETWTPFRRAFYVGNTADIEYWKYSYPLLPNHVPAWAVPCVAMLSPLCVIIGFRLTGRINRVEAHHACLLALCCVATTGLITNWVKIEVGRPRPHFVQRCWPNGLKPVFTPDGRPKCADNAIDQDEGQKSFPSGHTSWSTSGLGYLSFWLLGKLRCFDGSAQPHRFVLSLAPLMGAVWIGLSRIQDYWHHVEDVGAGFCLGLLMAFCFYRQIYASIMGPHAGMLTAALRVAGSSSSRGLLASPSTRGLLYGSGEQQDADELLPLSSTYGDERV